MNRDLDADIVKEIYGWKLVAAGSDVNGENNCEILCPPHQPAEEMYRFLPPMGKLHRAFFAPTYSSDLLLAINLAKDVQLPMTVIEMPRDPEELAQKSLDFYRLTHKHT